MKILILGVLLLAFICNFSLANNNYLCEKNNFDFDVLYTENFYSPNKTYSIDYNKDSFFAYYAYWNKKYFDYTKIPYEKFDYILHAFVWPKTDGSIYIPENFIYSELIEEVHKNGKKILLSIGGYNNSHNFSNLIGDQDSLEIFIKNLKQLLETNGYDGIDIDREFPKTLEEGQQYLNLLRYLNIYFPDKIITTALNGSPNYNYIDLCKLEQYVDYIFFMAYDLEGWQGFAGYNAPLYKNSKMEKDRSIFNSLNSNYLPYISNTKKIILGFPLYGKKFFSKNFYEKSNISVNIDFYKENTNQCNFGFDGQSLVPFLICEDYVISYDEYISFYFKHQLFKSLNLGGMFVWSLGDDKNNFISQIEFNQSQSQYMVNNNMFKQIYDYYYSKNSSGNIDLINQFFENIKISYSGNYETILQNIESNLIKLIYQKQISGINKEVDYFLKLLLFRTIKEIGL